MTQVALTTAAGSARAQGELWSVRARDYAEIQEPTFLPLYEDVLRRPELAHAGSLLDVGCGPGLAAQTMAKKFGKVAGVDASAPFIVWYIVCTWMSATPPWLSVCSIL